MKKLLSILTASVLCITMTACINQVTIASLVIVLGNAAASVAAIQGNPTLADKLKMDVATLSTQVLAWKKGTNAQMAIEAITIVEDDLSLFPQTGPYLPLTELALATVQSILAIIQANSPPTPPVIATRAHVVLLSGPAPKNAAQFKKQWNGICAANGLDPNVLIK